MDETPATNRYLGPLTEYGNTDGRYWAMRGKKPEQQQAEPDEEGYRISLPLYLTMKIADGGLQAYPMRDIREMLVANDGRALEIVFQAVNGWSKATSRPVKAHFTGRNLSYIAQAINHGECWQIEVFNRQRHEQPEDAAAPLVQAIRFE